MTRKGYLPWDHVDPGGVWDYDLRRGRPHPYGHGLIIQFGGDNSPL